MLALGTWTIVVAATALAQTGEFRALDDTPSDFANLNPEAVRPLALSEDGAELYALHVHGSQVVCFAGEPPAERARFDTPLFPVALAVDGDDLLVVCEGTTCLVRLDRRTGQVRNLLALPSEPGDLVVDRVRRRAYVACAGVDALVEVELGTFSLRRTLVLSSKRPRFLALEPDGSVLVAPGVSGNNTGVLGDKLVDLSDPEVAPLGGLPDQDLFRLRPGDTTLRPVLRGLGSLLFAHGRNPATGAYWMLNVQSLNADPVLPGERELRGRFARNELSIASLPATTSGSLLGTIDLDDVDPGPGVRYRRGLSVGQPFGLAFAQDGRAYLAAPSVDKVFELDPSGARRAELVLPDGSIPLGVLVDEAGGRLWVHAWGASELHAFELDSPTSQPALTLPLGRDPTPPSIRAGRRLFYDASFSAAERFTCNHCHPGGGADGLVWDLSDRPFDDKGHLVTQTLFGLEAKFPYHWRGERTLGEFNAAFRGLLGHAAPLPAEDFAALESFLFSLRTPANPGQDLTRRLVRRAGRGDPVHGQEIFTTVPTVPPFTCAQCHALPTGTNADVITFDFDLLPARTHREAPALWDGSLRFKEQPLVGVRLPGNVTIALPALGAGFQSRGEIAGLESFLLGFPLSTDDHRALQAFLEQLDHGLAPAAQAGWLLGAGSAFGVAEEIETILLEQAGRGWLDVVAWSRVEVDGAEGTTRWWFDPARELFLPQDARQRTLTWPELRGAAERDGLRVVVQGLPPGTGRAFVFEREGPELPPTGELAFVAPPRLLWSNARVAKLTFETSVPTDAELHFRTTVGPPRLVRSRDRARTHTLVLQDLASSAPGVVRFDYVADLVVTDARGKRIAVPLPSFASGDSIASPTSFVAVVSEAAWERADWDAGSGTLTARARFRLTRKPGLALRRPAADHVLVARLIVDGAVHGSFAGSAPRSFTLSGEPYGSLPGPFLFSSTSRVTGDDADGVVTLDFTATELGERPEIFLNVEALPKIDPAVFDPAAPDFNSIATLSWSLPDTRPELRRLRLELPREPPRRGLVLR
ncbi:MAG TPA: hypothetical protein VF530_10300 [Planctomycetota bacterium]